MRKSIYSQIMILFSVILIIFLLTASWSAFNLSGIQDSIDDIMSDNYDSVVATQHMIVALERQDSAVLSYLFTEDSAPLEDFNQQELEFMRWFSTAESNITEPEEPEMLEGIETRYLQFLRTKQTLISIQETQGQEAANDYYFEEVFPSFEQAKEATRDLQLLNQERMISLKDAAQRRAQNTILLTIVVAAMTVLIGGVLAYRFIRKTIEPIELLTDKVKAIAEGDYDQKIQVEGTREINLLSKEFNTMTKKLKMYNEMNVLRLMEEKKKAEAIVDSIHDAIIVTDADHKILLVNKEGERIFQIRENKVLENHFLEAVKEEVLFEKIKKVIREKKKAGEEHTLTLKRNEKSYTYRVQITPIYRKNSSFIGIITLLQDITKLKEIDQMKSDFISTVSHEFRTPLTSMGMSTGLLLDEVPGELTKDQRELIEAIDEDQKRLKDLVSDLLDLSRIESGKIELSIKEQKLEKIIEGALKAFHKQIEDQKSDVVVNLEEKLPKVRADYNKISWVLINLIGNALRYIPKNGEGKIIIDGKQVGPMVWISVTDNGVGIPREYREKIFEKFAQVKHEDDETVGGTGLGLAICKEIIKAHGGRIWVESKVGEGSKFTFTLSKEET